MCEIPDLNAYHKNMTLSMDNKQYSLLKLLKKT